MKRSTTIIRISLLIAALLPRPSYAAAGGVDLSFDAGSGFTGPIAVRGVLALQADGKLLLSGTFFDDDGNYIRTNILRLNVDGTRDTSFNITIEREAEAGIERINNILVQPDGKVLIGGKFSRVNGVNSTNIARFHPDGSLDTTFDARGIVSLMSMALQSDGKVLAGGLFLDGGPYIRRFETNGNPDASLEAALPLTYLLSDIIVQPDGKVLVSGGGAYWAEFIRRFNPDGSPDTSFQTNTVAGGGPIALQTDGKILTVDATFGTNNFLRLNSDGTADTSFHADLDRHVSSHGYVYSFAVQSDGKILIGGSFRQVNGTNRSGVARLNPNGSLDTYFDPRIYFDPRFGGFVSSVLLQPDGKVIIGGDFASVNGVARRHIVRLWSDAAVCTSWMRKVNGEFAVRFSGTPGLTYTVEYCESFSPTYWQKLTNRTAPTTATGLGVSHFDFQEPISPDGQRFYRAVYPAY